MEQIGLPCISKGCINFATWKGRCPQHQLKAFKNNHRKERLPADWASRRNIVLQRDKGVCYICGNIGADSVDHIVAGDDHSFENLAAIHQNISPYCHRTKTAYEGQEAKEGYKPATFGSYWAAEYERRKNNGN